MLSPNPGGPTATSKGDTSVSATTRHYSPSSLSERTGAGTSTKYSTSMVSSIATPAGATPGLLAAQTFLDRSANGGSTSTAASNSSAPVPQPSYNVSENALRMELEHRTAELSLKQKTITKLEQECLHHLKEAELARQREEEHVRAIAETAKREGEQNSRQVHDLKALLVSSEEDKEQLKRRIADLEVEVRSLSKFEIKLRETDRMLEDRQSRIEELRHERALAEERLQDLQRNDQTKVLEGRLEAMQVLCDQANSRAQDAENLATKRGNEVDEVVVESRKKEDTIKQLERTVGARDVAIESLNQEVATWERRVLDAELRTENARKQATHEQNLSKERETELNDALEKLRDEMRHLTKVNSDHEINTAKKETEMNLKINFIEQLEATLDRERNFKESIESRMRDYQYQSDSKDTELAKLEVMCRSSKQEVEQQKALIETLRNELDSMREQLRETAQQRDEALSDVSRLEGVEEKLQVLKGIHLRQGEDMGQSSAQLQQAKERLAEADLLINKLENLQQDLRDTKRENAIRGEAVEIALKEKKILQTELEEAMSHIQLAEGAARINETKLVAERDRRKDLERRLVSLESGYVGNMAVHGRYEALKTFLETSNSEAAKAQQLSFSLIEEVKILEGRLKESEKDLDKAREDKRRLEVKLVNVEVDLKGNLDAKHKLELVEKELEMANQRAFDLKKEGVHNEVVHNRYAELQSVHQTSNIELHELRAQMQSLRTSFHATRVELEQCRLAKESAEESLKEEMLRRDQDRTRFIRAREEMSSPGNSGGSNVERAMIAALETTLLEERASREKLIDRLHEANRQMEANQATITQLQAEAVVASPSRRSRKSIGHSSPLGGAVDALDEAEHIRLAAENQVLKNDNERLVNELQQADVRLADQQDRLNKVSGQLREAMGEMAAYVRGDHPGQGISRKSPSPSVTRGRTPVKAKSPARSLVASPTRNNTPVADRKAPLGVSSAQNRKSPTPSSRFQNKIAPRQMTVEAAQPSYVTPRREVESPASKIRSPTTSPVRATPKPLRQPSKSGRTPPPTNSRSAVKRASNTSVSSNSEVTDLRQQNTDLSLQLADAKSKLADILKSPRGIVSGASPPRGEVVNTRPKSTRGTDIGTTNVYSPPRPASGY